MSATDDNGEKQRRWKAEVRRAGTNREKSSDTGTLSKADAQQEDFTSESDRVQTAMKSEPSFAAEADEALRVEREGIQPDAADVTTDDSFDYIVPGETWKQHHQRKHKHSSKRQSKPKYSASKEREEMDAGFVFAKPHKHKKHHKHRHHKFRHLPLWKRILIIVLIVLLALIVAFTGTFCVLNEIGRRSLLNNENAQIVTPTQDELGNEIVQIDKRGHVVTYDGVAYELNDDLFSIAFIGVAEDEDSEAHALMADAIYILTVDTETGKTKILGISRDTMTDVDLYSENGKYIDTQRMQLAFSYAYGSDAVSGGKNTSASLSRLFYGLPMENYFAINMNALTTLNDTIGGVTLTSSMTFESPVDGRTIKKGETVTLHGREAELYIRLRDEERLDANNERMQRQQEYINAFVNSIIPTAKKDISTIGKLYDEIKMNSDTTLDLPKLTYIASTALTKLGSASDIEYVTLTGEIKDGEYAEMEIKNKDAIRTMLDVFYKPLADIPETIDR